MSNTDSTAARAMRSAIDLNPADLGIKQASRAVPLTKDIPELENQGASIIKPFDIEVAAKRAAEAGLAALNGEKGPAYDSLVYAAAITLHHLGKASTLATAADMVRITLDSGKALTHFKGHA